MQVAHDGTSSYALVEDESVASSVLTAYTVTTGSYVSSGTSTVDTKNRLLGITGQGGFAITPTTDLRQKTFALGNRVAQDENGEEISGTGTVYIEQTTSSFSFGFAASDLGFASTEYLATSRLN